MKRTQGYILVFIAILFGAGMYFFTPLSTKFRGFAGRLWSKSAVAMKTDRQLSENTYHWALTDLDGHPFDLKEVRGKVIFLNFWATWCGPCLKEMPYIQKLHHDYGHRVAFMLATQEDTATVNAFLKKKRYELPIYFFEEEEVPEEIVSKSLPTTYIIGTSGKIALAETGAVNWNSEEIRSLLDRLLIE